MRHDSPPQHWIVVDEIDMLKVKAQAEVFDGLLQFRLAHGLVHPCHGNDLVAEAGKLLESTKGLVNIVAGEVSPAVQERFARELGADACRRIRLREYGDDLDAALADLDMPDLGPYFQWLPGLRRWPLPVHDPGWTRDDEQAHEDAFRNWVRYFLDRDGVLPFDDEADSGLAFEGQPGVAQNDDPYRQSTERLAADDTERRLAFAAVILRASSPFGPLEVRLTPQSKADDDLGVQFLGRMPMRAALRRIEFDGKAGVIGPSFEWPLRKAGSPGPGGVISDYASLARVWREDGSPLQPSGIGFTPTWCTDLSWPTDQEPDPAPATGNLPRPRWVLDNGRFRMELEAGGYPHDPALKVLLSGPWAGSRVFVVIVFAGTRGASLLAEVSLELLEEGSDRTVDATTVPNQIDPSLRWDDVVEIHAVGEGDLPE